MMHQRRPIFDSLQSCYPIACVFIFVPVTILIGHPWFGIVLFIAIHFLQKTWWTCVFGLMNSMILWGGIIACLITYIRQFREVSGQ